jgi:hypothetical protein
MSKATARDSRQPRAGPAQSGTSCSAPRIILAPETFTGNHRTPGGTLMVSDVLQHEMIHAALMLRGEDASHNGAP